MSLYRSGVGCCWFDRRTVATLFLEDLEAFLWLAVFIDPGVLVLAEVAVFWAVAAGFL